MPVPAGIVNVNVAIESAGMYAETAGMGLSILFQVTSGTTSIASGVGGANPDAVD